MTTLKLTNIGRIREASLRFGDLTVLVGPQATGKSTSLQWLKLLADTGAVQEQLRSYGLDWSGDLKEFLDLYFGEGMRGLWRDGESRIAWNGRTVDMGPRVAHNRWGKKESVFLIPAQRVLALRDGWPRPFGDYAAGDPYAVRAYSEMLRLLMEKEFAAGQAVFPQPNRLKGDYKTLLQGSVFGDFNLDVDKFRSQKRLVLAQEGGEPLPYMVWSAGQREFVPLLLGLYWLMPAGGTPRRGDIDWVVIEELEMGLHPRAISTVLLLVLELLARGYRVCLSTHSPQVLDLVWALQALRRYGADRDALLDIFGAPHSQALRAVAEAALTKEAKVYFFEQDGQVRDISGLDPGSTAWEEAGWGGLMDFNERVNQAVAHAVANDSLGGA